MTPSTTPDSSRPQAGTCPTPGSLDILIFTLGGHRYGLDMARVLEIVRAVAVAPLPDSPEAVMGVVNLRGTLVPVFNLRGRFGLPSKDLDPREHFIIAESRSRLAALRVDRADGLASIARDDVADARTVVPGAELVTGAAKLPDGLVLIHDLDAFLSDAESARLDAAMAGTRSSGMKPAGAAAS